MLGSVQLRRLIATGTWLATTAAATTMVWMATSVVAADVTDRPARVVARADVVVALKTGAPGADTTPAVTAATAPTSTVPRRRPSRVVPVPPAPGRPTTEPPPQEPEPTTTPTLPPVTAPPAPPSPPPTTQPSPNPVAAFATAGGTVTVACNGYLIRLVTATPGDGYSVDVLDRGPATVDVHFTGSDGEVRVRVVCFGGGPIRIPDQHEQSGRAPGSP